MKIFVSLTLCLFITLPSPAFQGATRKTHVDDGSLQVSEDSLGSVILGQSVQLMTRDGTYVEGKVQRSRPTEIAVHIKSVEPRGKYKGPEAVIRTEDIAVVYLKKNGAVAAPVALGVVGGFAALWGAAYAAQDTESVGGAIAIGIAAIAGGATGGAILGREAVKKKVTINVTH